MCRNINEELPAGIGDDSYHYQLFSDDDLKIGDISGGKFSLNNHTIYQQYHDSNHGGVSSGYGF